MRPRKRVLVFAALETDMGATLFALHTRRICSIGIQTRTVYTLADFDAQLVTFWPDAALLFHDGEPSLAAQGAAAARAQGVPSLLVARRGELPAQHQADMFLKRNQASMTEIMRALGIILVRKRGPKPAHSIDQQLRTHAGQNAAAGL